MGTSSMILHCQPPDLTNLISPLPSGRNWTCIVFAAYSILSLLCKPASLPSNPSKPWKSGAKLELFHCGAVHAECAIHVLIKLASKKRIPSKTKKVGRMSQSHFTSMYVSVFRVVPENVEPYVPWRTCASSEEARAETVRRMLPPLAWNKADAIVICCEAKEGE